MQRLKAAWKNRPKEERYKEAWARMKTGQSGRQIAHDLELGETAMWRYALDLLPPVFLGGKNEFCNKYVQKIDVYFAVIGR